MGRNSTRQATQGEAASTAEVIKEPGAAERWWLRVKEDMQAQMTPAAWTSWFAPTRGLRLEGNTLVVQTPKGAQELFEHRWAALIAAILERAARPGLHVRYTQEG